MTELAPGQAREILPSEYIQQPWRNGRGVTRQILIWPPEAALDAFEWRISIAGVMEDGPFSRFPGYDRALMVLAGGPMILEAESDPQAMGGGSAGAAFCAKLEAGGPAARWSGNLSVHARLLGAAVTDLGVIARRGVWAASLGLWRGGASVGDVSGSEHFAGGVAVLDSASEPDFASYEVWIAPDPGPLEGALIARRGPPTERAVQWMEARSRVRVFKVVLRRAFHRQNTSPAE